ncbi:ImuA family protein [Azospirillum halopraeferens]|uniref:ImuA family protein n=1 Tax=Azospirillum halopraeferens TaxID=34010 RepID=UPI0003F5ED6D|nr:hypothetical protein [Azospirillum halopraeferens]
MPGPLPPSASVPVPTPAPKAAVLAGLRARIRRLEGIGGAADGRVLPFGVAGIDDALPEGGLPPGCLHELMAGDDPGAGTAFAAALLARLARAGSGPAVWIVRGRDLHAPGLAAYGLGPERLIAVRVRRDAEALWAMEEALRCRAVSAVLGEVGRTDLTAGRRLQLAAEAGGVTGLLLPREEPRGAGAAVTRWRIAAVPGVPPAGEPGVGPARWRVELLRCRGGRPGAWVVEWRDGAFEAVDPVIGAERPPQALARSA